MKFNFSKATQSVQTMLNGFIESVPYIVVAFIVFFIFVGLLIALVIAVPGFTPGQLISVLGISSTVTDSFWFLPALMALLASIAALGTVAMDHAIGSDWVQDIGWVWSGGPDGARGVLSVVAGSMMTVVSIVFSLTVTTLAQTSSHFGPRVLRNFTSDRGNQFTLGTFIATFVYCLLVLRTVRSVEESPFVPYLSVNVGILLALASLAVLIFFIHHISQSIQAENLIAAVGEDFQRALPVLFPERIGNEKGGTDGTEEPTFDWQSARPVKASRNGYVQRIDDEKLMRVARECWHAHRPSMNWRRHHSTPSGYMEARIPMYWSACSKSLKNLPRICIAKATAKHWRTTLA